MASAPTSHQALYRAVVKDAAVQGAALMQRIVRRAALDMPALAAKGSDVVERNLLAEAARVLMKHEDVLVEAFPHALLNEFARAIAGEARKAAPVSFDSLELMGEEQMRDSVDVMRMQQAVMRAAEAALTDLNALVSAVQGSDRVQPDRNPLRPEVYVRSLRHVIQQSPVSASVRRRWMTHLGTAMGPELALCYLELSQMLRSHGVAPAGLVVATSREDKPADQGVLNLRELRKLLSGELDSKPPGFSATMPAAFETLQEIGAPGDVVKRLREQPQGLGPAPGQVLGLEVVRLMVENIAGDERLLPPMRQAVRELEPALMRLALDDPRFFIDKQHPAREMLEAMTQRSLAWSAIDAPGFGAFYEPVRQAVDALLDTQASGPAPFAFALKSLLEAWGDARHQEARDSAVAQLEALERAAATEPAPLARDTQPGAPVDALAAAWPGELQPGSWVELLAGDWTRWQLTWVTPQRTLFLFTHPSGRTQSVSRAHLEAMLAASTLRLVSSQAVVAGALDAVAQAALRNSLDL